MNKVNCVIRIKDVAFSEALKGMIAYSGYFNTWSFEQFNPDTSGVSSDAILFTDEIVDLDEIRFSNILLFSDNKEGIENINLQRIRENNPSLLLLEVSKYIRFSELLTRLFNEFSLELENGSGWQFGGAKHVIRLGLYSAKGGIGTSMIADGIGRLLYRHGYKPMILDFSPIDINANNNNANNNRDLNVLLYNLIRRRKININQFAVEKDGVSRLSRNVVDNNYEFLKDDTLDALMDSIIKSDFDVIIYDFGNHLYYRYIEMLRGLDASILILPTTDERGNLIKANEEKYRELLELGSPKRITLANDFKGGLLGQNNEKPKNRNTFAEGLLNRFNKNNENDGMDSNVDRYLLDLVDILIPYYGSINERSIDGDFGQKIKELIEIVMGELYV